MQIAVMLYSFRRPLEAGEIDLDDAFSWCAECGAEGIEPTHSLTAKVDTESLRGLALEYGLTIPCYDMGAKLIHPEAEVREAAARAVVAQVERAHALGARQALLVPGFLSGDITRDEARRCTAEGLRPALATAAALGMTISVEQMGPRTALCTSGAEMRAVVEEVASPQFALTYDPGNFLLTGEDCVQPLHDLLPWVTHVHMKDFRRDGLGGWEEVPAGEGEVPLREVYEVLREGRYHGSLSVEYCGPETLEGVQAGVQFLRELTRTTVPKR